MNSHRSCTGRVVLVVGIVLANLLGSFALLAMIEGSASLLLVAEEFFAVSLRTEQVHTEYDPEIGWINRPSVHFPDLYGPGLGLHTNSRRFRGERETESRVPPGMVRVLYVGDSFTLGYGVDDSETWCGHLERSDPRIESVNLGQGGYGLD